MGRPRRLVCMCTVTDRPSTTGRMLQVPLVRKAKRVATQLNCGATQFYCVATDAAVATRMPLCRWTSARGCIQFVGDRPHAEARAEAINSKSALVSIASHQDTRAVLRSVAHPRA
jgi:hypothetical protein